MNELTINDRVQLGALWRLRGRLTLRQFGRERGRIVGMALVILIMGPLVLAAAYGTAMGYRHLEDQWPTALLGGVLTLLWLIWLLFPLIFSSLNEGADITLLMTYPIRRRTLIANVVLGTLFDYPTYLMLPLFLVIFYSFGLTFSPTALIVLLALALSYGHLVMIGQFVGTAVGGIMQSRRVRDIAIILASTLGGFCYFINIGIQRLIGTFSDRVTEEQAQAFLAWQPLNLLQWLPPGAAARAIERSLAGDWLLSLAWLFYSLVWLALLTWVWYKLLVRLTTGEGYLLTVRPRQEAVRQKAPREAAKSGRPQIDWLRWLPDDIALLTTKEFKSVWRIPQRRVGIIQGVLMPVFFMAVFFFTDELGTVNTMRLPAWVGLGLPLYAMFLFWANTQNILAWEGKGLPALLLTPIPRARIFWAKGLALFVVTVIPFLFISGLFVFFQFDWASVAGVLTGVWVGVAAMAVTTVASVLFPIPIQLEARRNRSIFQSGGDSKTGCLYITLVPLCVLVFSVPATIPLIIAYWLELPWLAFVAVILSAVYALVLFWGGSKLAGNLLLEREPELIAKMKLPDE